MKDFKSTKKFWNKKKVFITGHTGFKGTWLCIILNYLNSSIYGYSLKPKKNSLFNKTKISKDIASNTYADINDFKKLKKKIKHSKSEILFHLAAQPLVLESYKNPIKTFKTNMIGTLNVLECIKNIKSIKSAVIITSDKVYKIKKQNNSYTELDELGGEDPYSASKAASEIIVESYIKSFFKTGHLRNRVSTARAGNVIGGGDFAKDRLVPDILRSINNKKKITVRNPNFIRPWQHILDPLIGYLSLAKKQYENKLNNQTSWNFGPNKANFKTVIEIIQFIKKLHNFEYDIIKMNKFNETKTLKLNSSKSKKKLNWSSKWDLYQSLKQTIDWNNLYKKGHSARDICEKQILMYINKK
jgi:CDP-glucose 4,6-dehydratase